jgi:hypothetical protein
MAGLVPAIHAFVSAGKGVEARDERGRDGFSWMLARGAQ